MESRLFWPTQSCGVQRVDHSLYNLASPARRFHIFREIRPQEVRNYPHLSDEQWQARFESLPNANRSSDAFPFFRTLAAD